MMRFRYLIILFVLLFTPMTSFASTYSVSVKDPSSEHKTWFLYDLEAGDSKDDILLVKNLSDETLEFDILPSSATYNEETTAFHPKVCSESKKEICDWILLDEDKITIPAHSTFEVPFTLALDKKASPDMYYGAILVAPSVASRDAVSGSAIQTRLGTRIYLTVSEGSRVALLSSLPEYIYWAIPLSFFLIISFIYFIFIRKSKSCQSCD